MSFCLEKPRNSQFILYTGRKLFCPRLFSRCHLLVSWPPRWRGGRGVLNCLHELWILSDNLMHVLAIWELKGGSTEQVLPSPDPARSRSSSLSSVPTETPRVEGRSNWFFLVLASCSFAPCCFCSQEGGAVTVILWAGCCNTGIGKLAWGKGSRLRSKLDAKCVGRNLETSFFREGRQHQSLYWWCVGFRDKRGVPVAVTLTGRGCCPSQLLLLGCCSLRSCSVTQGLSRDAFCVRANNR